MPVEEKEATPLNPWFDEAFRSGSLKSMEDNLPIDDVAERTGISVETTIDAKYLQGKSASAFEPALGSPDTTGFVLASTKDGSRFWTIQSGGAAVMSLLVAQSVHGFSVGDVVKCTGANTYAKAMADTAANAEVAGIVSAVANVDNFTLFMEGYWESSSVPAVDAGTVMFLSPTVAGSMTSTAPTTDGQISKPIGVIIENGAKMLVYNWRGVILGTWEFLGLEDLTDPGADRIFFWDESENATKWLACGDSIAITGTTLDTIQDIRTTAGPTFDHLHLTTDLPVSEGGTGVSTFALNGVLYGNAANAIGVTAIGAEGQIIRAGASPFVPAWTTATFPATTTINQLLYSGTANIVSGLSTAASGVLVTSAGGVPSIATDIPTAVTIGTKYVYRAEGTDIPVADGGTNKSSWTLYAIPYASGTTTIGEIAIGTAGQVLAVNVGANGYTWAAAVGALALDDLTDVVITSGAVGDILLKSGANWTNYADVAVGSYLRSGGVGAVPAWSTLTLPNAGTAYRLPVFSATNVMTELAAVGATGEYLAGNTGAIPSWANTSAFEPALGNPAVTGYVLSSTTLGVRSWIELPAAAPHDLLSATHSDTLADGVERGDLLIGNSTPAWSRLAKGTEGYILTMGANEPAWAEAPAGGGDFLVMQVFS